MSDLTCLSCGADQTNGLALCDLCQMRAAKCLEFLPIYFLNLSRWRPGRAGSRPVPGSREPTNGATGATDRVSVALDQAGNDLTTWARTLIDDRPNIELPASNDEAASVKVACWLLTTNLASIGTLEWCGQMVASISDHEEKLRKLTEQVAPGWYAGACRVCESGTFVVPGLTWVTCQACGSTTYARDHLETVLDEAREWLARPKALAEALVALTTEQSVPRLYERIRKWSQRGAFEGERRVDRDGDATGPKRYRLGDVLDVLRREGETRIVAVDAQAS